MRIAAETPQASFDLGDPWRGAVFRRAHVHRASPGAGQRFSAAKVGYFFAAGLDRLECPGTAGSPSGVGEKTKSHSARRPRCLKVTESSSMAGSKGPARKSLLQRAARVCCVYSQAATQTCWSHHEAYSKSGLCSLTSMAVNGIVKLDVVACRLGEQSLLHRSVSCNHRPRDVEKAPHVFDLWSPNRGPGSRLIIVR